MKTDPPDSSSEGEQPETEPDCGVSLDLVRRAQGGENSALSELFARYYDRVHRIVRLRLGRGLRGHLESVDILQETFAAAVFAFDRFEMRQESSLLRWLARIAENQIRAAADYHFAQKRNRQGDVALQLARAALDSGEVVCDPSDDGPQPLEGLVHDEDLEIVESCLAKLRPHYRDVILMRDYVGGRWEDVRRWLDANSVEAVRMLHARAVTELAGMVRRRTDPS